MYGAHTAQMKLRARVSRSGKPRLKAPKHATADLLDWTVCIMSVFPIPSNERERLKEYEKLRFREWSFSDALDELCSIASRLLATPISYVSLVNGDEQIIAGRTGLAIDCVAREVAFCAHTIMTPAPLLVEDATADPRFANNPFVTGEPGIRSYLGVPLETSPGLLVGALCAVDTKPHAFSNRDIETLVRLSHIVVAVIKSRVLTLELDEQLNTAIALQQDMLPSFERLSEIQDEFPLDVASFYKPLDAIGGDIWNIEVTDPNRVMMYITDFTGHGVPAALNAARFHSFVHVLCEKSDNPSSLLTKLNRKLCEVLPEGQFATMFCATIDFRAQAVEFASAGAPPMLYRKCWDTPFRMLSKPGLPLGVVPDEAYGGKSVPFNEGGALVLYTDGLIEAPRPPHSIFTTETLRDYLDARTRLTSQEVCESILSRLEGQATDDTTLVIAKCTGGALRGGSVYSH
jgi:hypothetical protein